MERLTKAAIATGGAAVLLLGGAGTMAYWTAESTLDAGDVTSGNVTLDGTTCGEWTYDDAEGTGAVTAIVPGDVVTTTCAAQVSGSGDHLRVTAELDADVVAGGELGPLLTVTTGTVLIDGDAVPAEGFDLSGGGPVDITVEVEVEFPYEPEQDPDASAGQFDLTATFTDAVVIAVTQVHA